MGNTRRKKSRKERAFKGKFEFRSFEGFNNNAEPIFEAVPVNWEDNHYVLKKDTKVGDQFQLWLTTPLKNNSFIYVFSVDASNKVQVHWPRKESLNPKHKGMNESAFVIQHAKLKIPGLSKLGNERVLTLEKAGTDHLVVLFSTKKFRNFKTVCEKMQYRKNNFASDLQQLLGNHAIPSADIDYNYEEMSFEVHTRSIGYVVPMVLEVYGQ